MLPRLIASAALILCVLHAEPAPGLSVSPDGVLLKNGVAYRGIGLNYFDLFLELLNHPARSTLEADLNRLARAGIPFVRFAASGFWPKDNDLYLKDKAAYFERLDHVVRAAESAGIGLMPTLFWHFATVPDIVGEPVSAWGDTKSRTHRFMREYTRDVVRRYRRSAAIWAWEFGNEWNDQIDLPREPRHRAAIVPDLGTPATRSYRDDMSLENLVIAYTEFVKEVRAHDTRRAVSAGNNLPRASAWHRNSGRLGVDTWNEWAWMLLKQNAPFPLLSVHIYLNRGDYFPGGPRTLTDLLALLRRIGYAARKPVFLGEFGTVAGDHAEGVRQFQTLLEAVERADIPLSAVWNFGPRPSGGSVNWNIHFDNQNQWMLEALKQANTRMTQRAAADSP